ncbi:MAG: UDP-N-acetylglucosamine--N-acetylmuramyl-(pentapeptide) pyrophosphoryl-undecaprenol N-acetylglucosamine transferase [Patescibacteria group bacterium]|jgi:UDP-N-acetylglucosamine--N-acetylmuramyl-(pentapeptide) pyrophosphoryl-undecaprenol N-acetylglucosamine transferase|nr:UDP-N-acetylglucosamine--N-acetylmuramyl-(pentapeptide) pyrophosphoryl-undecaprenol N-acetylglucosamine transferase [Patescibacteria group bacterium]MDD3939418.1 UDP-N-acetylglucosamine--N-acetylmuramyl-(pentapeptide) pyrophosphoryl-undecaprenol N-acetylglucosamine transferase [Patescibacteria group bacterium]MDD4443867.1 UDP-N-acetylglucosamine--N-acetylmuramyl-(pentapeptide) pyrophosphoryl-undecaprenol N-acetylglucosamine transferase [Patescibacteria group bacterium]
MSKKKEFLKIMFSGGGTGGSVTPLLAVAKELRENIKEIDLLFVGTKNGPEKKLVSTFHLPGTPVRFRIIKAGKWRRYFSWRNFFDIFQIIIAFFQSCILLIKEKPDVVVSAGGFVSVPLAWAAFFQKIPVLVHQQDVRPGLANRLMAKTAQVISTTFAKSLNDYGSRAQWIGNPAPQKPADSYIKQVRKQYELVGEKPLVIITGGGTGAAVINQLTWEGAERLSQVAQVFHLTGAGKAPSIARREKLAALYDYKWREIISSEEMLALIADANLVVSRCGLATLTELCAFNKSAILIPMPNSHQEDNAAVFSKKEAALVLDQEKLDSYKFSESIINLLNNDARREALSYNIEKVMKKDARERMAQLILQLANK